MAALETIIINSIDETFTFTDNGDCLIFEDTVEQLVILVNEEVVSVILENDIIDVTIDNEIILVDSEQEILDFVFQEIIHIPTLNVSHTNIIAGEDIGQYQVVYLKNSAWFVATSQLLSEDLFFGLSVTPTLTGNNASIITQGIVNSNTFSFDITKTIYLGLSGSIIQNFTGTENINIIVGYVISPTSIYINFSKKNESMIPVKQVDFVGDTVIYKGEASPGSLTDNNVWRIVKLTISVDGDVSEQFADGNSSYDNIWDDRLLLVYI